MGISEFKDLEMLCGFESARKTARYLNVPTDRVRELRKMPDFLATHEARELADLMRAGG